MQTILGAFYFKSLDFSPNNGYVHSSLSVRQSKLVDH